jgi:hypothetical protein
MQARALTVMDSVVKVVDFRHFLASRVRHLERRT